MNQPAPEILAVFLEEALTQADALGRAIAELSDPRELKNVARIVFKLKGAAGAVGLSSLAGYLAELEPVLALAEEGGGAARLAEAKSLLGRSQAVLRDWLERLRKDPHFVPDLTKPAPAPAVPPRLDPTAIGKILVEKGEVTPEQLDRAVKLQNRKLGEVMVDEGMVSSDTVARALAAQKSATQRQAGEQIRVPASRVDALLKIVGELSIQQAIVWHSRQTGTLHGKAAQDAISLSNKIIREVQAQVMSLRLQPLRSLFQRLERVGRDVALSQGKKVDIRVEGADVDLDKAVIEKITDSLIHVLRNAVDHGIEPPGERPALGKPETATLVISAFQDAGDVIITVKEDGRGMDPQKILAKAVEKGFVQPSQELKTSEILNLVFLPGFSTAEQVTEFSGRGVGMDVVNRVISELGGAVAIESEVGRGTALRLSIPTSVSLMEAVVFVVDGLRYVVPMRELVEVADLAGYRQEGHGSRGHVIRLRDDVVPVERMRDYLPRTEAVTASEATVGGRARIPALLAQCEEGMIAFEVDEILGQQQIVVRALTGNMAELPGFVGGTILGDGEPGMIVGLGSIARSYFRRIRSRDSARRSSDERN
ncbi:MAG: ATP-binding protein [Oligoflexia bacterium]|nr:ATP-binding protein [Oligoflexia bacterium]